jgi:hypothetical protein
LYWDSKDNLKCSVCDEIAAIRSKDVIHVFEGYGAYENTIMNQYGKPHSKSQEEDDEWKDAKDNIRKWQIEEDPSYIPKQYSDEDVDSFIEKNIEDIVDLETNTSVMEDIPFTEKVFDDEDSAAGDSYLCNDEPAEEGEDE